MLEGGYKSIGDLLERQTERFGDKEFLVAEPESKVFTYGEFYREVMRAAQTLACLGVTKGQRVSLYLTNRAEYLTFYFACFKIGAWAGPINAMLKPQEVAFIISNSEASTVVTQSDLYHNLSLALDSAPTLRQVIIVGRGQGAGVRNSIQKGNQLTMAESK